MNRLFTACSCGFQGHLPRQRPLRSVQVQAAQSRPVGEVARSQGVLLQSHTVRPPSPRGHWRPLHVAKEKRAGALPETGLHEEGGTLCLWTVTAERVDSDQADDCESSLCDMSVNVLCESLFK